ncbi:MAG: hypothetical protein IT473_06995 [Lysobacter sp.]|nr:hypothetical protein [Lysobacter sp.]
MLTSLRTTSLRTASLRIATLSLLAFCSIGAFAQDAAPQPAAASTAEAGNGTLIIDVKPFNSEKDLPKKVVKQLKSGMIEWGIRDRQLVFTLVNKRFLDFPVNHTTRYGSTEQLSLPAGEYKITGVGIEMSTGFSVDKILERGAFFNDDIVIFKIEPGKTTTLNINPMIKIDRTFAVNFWIPSLMTSVSDGATATPEVALNDRNDTSIPWPQYTGPLKFIAK